MVLCFAPLIACNLPEENQADNSSVYLNHSDTAKYVGINTCKLCHQSIYETYTQTGMGRSIGLASRLKSSANFNHAEVYDNRKELNYKAYWQGDSLYMHEFRLSEKDTAHSLINRVNYIIGSGQHTNSHLHLSGQYLTQMPMTFYTQKQKWDLPPGFENGLNTRFSRKIGLECMTCHNAYPDFVMGSENKYQAVPEGIDCERCHGPGSIHVAQRSTGSLVDTSKFIDYSIVNPSKLSIDLQFDVCQRCHLQGNTILKEDKSFYDFKPGQKLSDVMTVFLPKYKNAEEEFIMASHADRLKQSACFIKSFEKSKSSTDLKPYKNALTCITCHNPHVSVKSTNPEVFDEACMNCHGLKENIALKHNELKEFKSEHCYDCHMPVSGSIDIPHVTVHDHFIRKPVSNEQKNKVKQFLGLYAINEKNPKAIIRAKAYLNQYDKFEQNQAYLDSARYWLNQCEEDAAKFQVQVQLYFTEGKSKNIIELLKITDEEKVYNLWAVKASYDNAWAWTSYRIGEAYDQNQQLDLSLKWFKKAAELAPFQLDFRNKLGNALAKNRQISEAKDQFRWMISENPGSVSAYSNLAYLLMLEGKTPDAVKLLKTGIRINPDNESLLLNLASVQLQLNDINAAKYYLRRVLKLNKNNVSAQMALRRIETKP